MLRIQPEVMEPVDPVQQLPGCCWNCQTPMFTVLSSPLSFIKSNTKRSGLNQRCVIEKHIIWRKGPLRKSVYDKGLKKKQDRRKEA